MGQKNKISPGYQYFMTLTVIDWIDVFTKARYKHIILESFEFCQNEKGLIIHAWVLMSNHIHLIISAKEKYNLSDIIRDFKKYTSKQIVKTIESTIESRKDWMLNRFESMGAQHRKNIKYQFWQEGNEPKEIHTNEFLQQKLDYIHNNPVVAEIVDNAVDYKYSSACNYAGEKGLLDIELIE